MLTDLGRAPPGWPETDPTGWPRAVLFDLDGTLIDSVPDLATSVNRLLESNGLARLDLDEVRPMIGNGVKKLVQRAFATHSVQLEGQRLAFTTERMMGIYRQHLTVGTTLMTGAIDTVSNLATAGIKIGVVTNKPEEFSRRILDHFELSQWISVVVGGDTGPTRNLHRTCLSMPLHKLASAQQKRCWLATAPRISTRQNPCRWLRLPCAAVTPA